MKHRSVGPEMIDTALHVCEDYLSVLEHGDIDVSVQTPPTVEEQQWAEFLQDYYKVVQWVCFFFLRASSVCWQNPSIQYSTRQYDFMNPEGNLV